MDRGNDPIEAVFNEAEEDIERIIILYSPGDVNSHKLFL